MILYATRRHSFEVGRGMLDVLVDVIEVIDADGRIAYASASLTRSFGFRPEAIIVQRFLHVFLPAQRSAELARAV